MSLVFLPFSNALPRDIQGTRTHLSRCSAACLAMIWSTLSASLLAETGGLGVLISDSDVSVPITVFFFLDQKVFSLTEIHDRLLSPPLIVAGLDAFQGGSRRHLVTGEKCCIERTPSLLQS
jgi:hypothetical protein